VASATSQPGSQRSIAPVEHCVANPDGTERRCFDTYRDAIAFASNGKVTDVPMDTRAAMSDPRFLGEMETLTTQTPEEGAQASTLGDGYVIGATIFGDTNYGGNTLTVMISKPCAKDGKYDTGLGDLGFMAKEIESLQPWANCWVWLHDSSDWNGNRQGPYKEATSDVGDWKNRAVMVGLS
jgi:hypothetical protein